jgi:hypothetical protein
MRGKERRREREREREKDRREGREETVYHGRETGRGRVGLAEGRLGKRGTGRVIILLFKTMFRRLMRRVFKAFPEIIGTSTGAVAGTVAAESLALGSGSDESEERDGEEEEEEEDIPRESFGFLFRTKGPEAEAA